MTLEELFELFSKKEEVDSNRHISVEIQLDRYDESLPTERSYSVYGFSKFLEQNLFGEGSTPEEAILDWDKRNV